MFNFSEELTTHELRWFAAVGLPLFTSVASILVWRSAGLPHVATAIAVLMAPLCVAGMLRPDFIRPLYLVWKSASWSLSWILGFTLLAITFYVVITPLGCFLRCIGRDALDLRQRLDAETYWRETPSAPSYRQYFRQF
jgi:hypothetical protein